MQETCRFQKTLRDIESISKRTARSSNLLERVLVFARVRESL